MPEVTEEMKRVLREAGLTEDDVAEAIASISTLQEVTPIRDGEQYRAYEGRYHKMMQDAGFVGQKRSWKNTWITFGRLREGWHSIFNRMAEWKAAKRVP